RSPRNSQAPLRVATRTKGPAACFPRAAAFALAPFRTGFLVFAALAMEPPREPACPKDEAGPVKPTVARKIPRAGKGVKEASEKGLGIGGGTGVQLAWARGAPLPPSTATNSWPRSASVLRRQGPT